MSSKEHHSLLDKTIQFCSQKRVVIGHGADLFASSFTCQTLRNPISSMLLVCPRDRLAPEGLFKFTVVQDCTGGI